jgi:hypothetical protein
MKHPGHTYGGFVSTISERGMTMNMLLVKIRLLLMNLRKKKSNKSDHHTKTTIKLTGSCYLATKSYLNEIDASTATCYALVCKETLFSIEDIFVSLPPSITNLLQEYADVFPKEVAPRLPPIWGIEH